MSANLPDSHYDVAVVGGGIHGVSMACEAASRGLKVILLEGQDLASGASSATSTMLSGGLRKVEQLAWGQVRRNLIEQAIMMRRAPHLVSRRRYTIIENTQVRSRLRLQTMLWVYQRLQKVEAHQSADRRRSSAPRHLLREPDRAIYTYDDCSGLDYRMVLCTALQARNWGADIRPRHRVVAAQRQAKHWSLTVQPQQSAAAFMITATSVINSCGWLANDLLDRVLKCPSRCRATAVNAGHVIVRKTYPGHQGYVLQASDKNLIYVTPLLDKYLLIGPTFAHDEDSKAAATDDLIALYNRHFNEALTPSDLMHERWAKHAVFDDPSTATPQLDEAVLDLNNPFGGAPLLNVFGLDFVTHRLISERGLDILHPFIGKRANAALVNQTLPGGDIAPAIPGGLTAELQRAYPQLNEHLLNRLALTYGTLTYQVLGERRQMPDLGEHFGHNLYEVELLYLQKHEWAVNADDVLWRRTQLGIKFTPDETAALQHWFGDAQTD